MHVTQFLHIKLIHLIIKVKFDRFLNSVFVEAEVTADTTTSQYIHGNVSIAKKQTTFIFTSYSVFIVFFPILAPTHNPLETCEHAYVASTVACACSCPL